jgi:RNA polymerase sigma-70 factor (ECF subfamily)
VRVTLCSDALFATRVFAWTSTDPHTVTLAYLLSPEFLDDDGAAQSEGGRAAVRRAGAAAARDSTLADDLRGGNDEIARAALDALINDYSDRLVRFAYGLVRSADTAEDVVQDVFVRVWNGRHALRPDQSLRAYLFTGVRRRALDVLKHASVEARHAKAVEASHDPILLMVDDQLDADTVAAAVRVAIGRLSERRQTALRLRYEETLPFALVAEVMGISEKAAKDLVSRAVHEVRGYLGV